MAAGATLLAVISTLAVAATSHRSYRRTALSKVGGLGLIALDLTMLTAVPLLGAVPLVWAMILAIPASATRALLTARTMTRPARTAVKTAREYTKTSFVVGLAVRCEGFHPWRC
jgi:hypothetical protein